MNQQKVAMNGGGVFLMWAMLEEARHIQGMKVPMVTIRMKNWRVVTPWWKRIWSGLTMGRSWAWRKKMKYRVMGMVNTVAKSRA